MSMLLSLSLFFSLFCVSLPFCNIPKDRSALFSPQKYFKPVKATNVINFLAGFAIFVELTKLKIYSLLTPSGGISFS